MNKFSSKTLKNMNSKEKTRENLDKYYTGAQAVETVLGFMIKLFNKEKINISEFSFLEPCAGDGAFLKGLNLVLPKAKVLAYDIAPENEKIKKADFLKIKPSYSNCLISIGNPPFGYKGDLAAAFINNCANWSPIIVFVLPIQFRRYNIQKQISKNLKLIYSSENFPVKSFVLNGKPFNVNCLFQIWVRNDWNHFKNYPDLRLLKALPNKHNDFKLFIHNNTQETLKYFNKDVYKWDFAVARQGFYDYSKKITNPKELRKNVQYLFVKYINPCAKIVFEKIDFPRLSHVNTAILGFSNTDLVNEYCKIKKTLKL